MSDLRINRALNLVVPVDTDRGTVYVHSTPISREIFERYFMVMARAFATMTRMGLSFISGPKVGALALKQAAIDMNVLPDVEAGLIPEIRRLTNVVRMNGNGWEMVPFQDVLDKRELSADDLAEVEGIIDFFILNSAMLPRRQVQEVLDGLSSLWDARIESSTVTEFMSSLPTSTGTDSSGETVPISSVPS